MLQRTKRALAKAHCKLGTVTKPKKGGNRKGKKRPLVVKSSSPRAGKSPADGIVDLRLHRKPRR